MEESPPGLGGCGSCSSRQDGGAKKRKLSAYNIFMRKELKQIKQAYPSKSQAECMKMAAKKWKMVKPPTPKSASKSKSKSRSKAKKPRK